MKALSSCLFISLMKNLSISKPIHETYSKWCAFPYFFLTLCLIKVFMLLRGPYARMVTESIAWIFYCIVTVLLYRAILTSHTIVQLQQAVCQNLARYSGTSLNCPQTSGVLSTYRMFSRSFGSSQKYLLTVLGSSSMIGVFRTLWIMHIVRRSRIDSTNSSHERISDMFRPSSFMTVAMESDQNPSKSEVIKQLICKYKISRINSGW